MTKIMVRKFTRVGAVALLACAGFAFAQDVPTAPTNTQSNSSAPASSTGGWRRIGDPQTQPQQSSTPTAQQSDSQISQSASGGPTAAPSTYPESNYPQAQPPYPQAQPPYPQAQPPQNGQQTMGDGPMQQTYPQMPPAATRQTQQYPMQPPQGNYQVPTHVLIPAGTYVTVRVNQQLSSDHNQVGDAFTATIARPVVADGIVVAEPGQTIGGRVAQVQKSGHVSGLARLGVELTDLTLVDGQQLPVKTTFVSRAANSTAGRDAGAIVGTTAVGAAIGAAADWGRGAAIGAGAGLVASTIGVLVTRGQPSVIYPEQTLTFKLEQPLDVSTERSPQAFRFVQPNQYGSQMAYGGTPGYSAPPPAYPVAPGPYAYGYPYYGYPYYPYAGGFSLFVGPGYYGRGFYGGPRYYGGFGIRGSVGFRR